MSHNQPFVRNSAFTAEQAAVIAPALESRGEKKNLPQKEFSGFTGEAFLAGEVAVSDMIISFQEDRRWPTASLTKLMTALVALDNLKSDQEVVIQAEDIGTEKDLAGLKPQEVFTVHDLVKAMMRVSSNNAALALTDFYGRPKFIQLMNDKARELGMSQTVFFDETGLSYLNQSTATDLKRLTEYILHFYPEVLTMSREKEGEIVEQTRNEHRKLININIFAGVPNFLGGKTGYTDDAGGNLVSVFTIQGREIIIVVLGTKDRFLETEKITNYLGL